MRRHGRNQLMSLDNSIFVNQADNSTQEYNESLFLSPMHSRIDPVNNSYVAPEQDFASLTARTNEAQDAHQTKKTTYDILSVHRQPKIVQRIKQREATHNFVRKAERKSRQNHLNISEGPKRSSMQSMEPQYTKADEHSGFMSRRQEFNKHSLLDMSRKVNSLHGHTSQGPRQKANLAVPPIQLGDIEK